MVERCQITTGDKIDGVYQVEAFLGEGAFGQVFRVRDAKGVYALKLLKMWEIPATERPGLLTRFDREYETGRIASHYLVHSISKGNTKGNPYFVMEYCPGGNLSSAIKKAPLDLALLGRHVLLGLKELHVNGKVHRDLKPENVLLKDERHALLTDFGISGDQNNRITQRNFLGVPQQRFGTIPYMPPEQVNPPKTKSYATVLPTTDVFSFGVMIYQLLVGRFPFGELKVEQDLPRYWQHVKDGEWDRAALTKVKNGVLWQKVLEGCLKPDFKDRWQTTDQMLQHLPPAQTPDISPVSPRPNTDTVPYKKDMQNGLLLRVMQGEEYGRVYILNDLFTHHNTLLCIGRSSSDVWNHIGIRETESCYVSRQHCTIEKDMSDNTWLLRDGQFRSQCPVGLIQNHIFPCQQCKEPCRTKNPGMRWKESLNGTYVNSEEVTRSGIKIRPGDIISIGDVKMRVEGA